MAVAVAVTARFIREGYRHIYLYSEHCRLAALKTYLKLGYIPLLYTPEMSERRRMVGVQWPWRFTSKRWQESDSRV